MLTAYIEVTNLTENWIISYFLLIQITQTYVQTALSDAQIHVLDTFLVEKHKMNAQKTKWTSLTGHASMSVNMFTYNCTRTYITFVEKNTINWKVFNFHPVSRLFFWYTKHEECILDRLILTFLATFLSFTSLPTS